MTHTPRPWNVDAVGQIFVTGIGPQPRICFVDGPSGKQAWEVAVTEAEKAFNAQLIAAAPDLLNDAAFLLAALKEMHANGETFSSAVSIGMTVLGKTIAKATEQTL